MKHRIIPAAVLSAALLFGSAGAEHVVHGVDLEKLSWQELGVLRGEALMEMIDRADPAYFSAQAGLYRCGSDFPAGKYEVTPGLRSVTVTVGYELRDPNNIGFGEGFLSSYLVDNSPSVPGSVTLTFEDGMYLQLDGPADFITYKGDGIRINTNK